MKVAQYRKVKAMKCRSPNADYDETFYSRVLTLMADHKSRFASEIAEDLGLSPNSLGHVLPFFVQSKAFSRTLSSLPNSPLMAFRYKLNQQK